ncbi:MAG: metallophosphoesterase [Candidatus Marsarchaeota archaeon]|nr:metallophosphoesterase [Candidatus Marsarchaeota archaeon]
MIDESRLRELAMKLSAARIFLSADAREATIDGIDMELLATRVIEKNRGSADAVFAGAKELDEIVRSMSSEKVAEPIEVLRQPGFKPVAAELEPEIKIDERKPEHVSGTVDDFVDYFRDRLARLRRIIESNRQGLYGLVPSMESLRGFPEGREVTIIGIVTTKFVTKSGNILAIIEDETAEAKAIFMNGTSQKVKELFVKAESITNDEVIAVRGKLSRGFLMVSEIVWPDIPIKSRRTSENDLAIAFLSDVHVGSKLFMDKNFRHMLSWLNGGVSKQEQLAGKIKYIIIAGDAADGIGVYPGQDRDLAIQDVYLQYRLLINLLDAVPDYVHVFILPGNHDAVQRAEPQPSLGKAMVEEMGRGNIHMVTNPCSLTLDGFEVLAYHGTSLDSVISAVPNNSYARPEKAMVELLRRRHLSPIYGGNVVVPSRKDGMVIESVPDILHMGHIHKNGLTEYHGVEVVNSGTWQARTEFQVRQGHIPSPCVLPVFETKEHRFSSINFGDGQ